MDKLQNKIAIITGASRGLGKAIAALYAQEGARVVLSARSRLDLDRNVGDLSALGHTAVAYPCDVSDPKQVEALALFTIQEFGHFDIWVNNAGMAGPYGPTMDLTPDQFQEVLRTNIIGVYNGSTIAMRHFLARRSGKLINILGAGSRAPAPNQNAYGSSKAWIRVFSLALAREYKDSGVGVYALQPGLMETDLLTEIRTFEDQEERLRRIMPFLIRAAGRQPEVPARKALWLASSATDGRTGLDVRVNSSLSFLLGFTREGLRNLFHLPAREVEMKIQILPSALDPLHEITRPHPDGTGK